ncbi:hypothetical protein, partial [Rhizobium sp. CG5]|uniref:hypothetical protein n=1 Tax=Rhizobium sp. CG5 TaxID=2726076 RepID=UPI0020348C7B
ARLVLLQYADNLFVCETVALHSLVLSIGQSLLQNGLVQRGKVKRGKVRDFLQHRPACEGQICQRPETQKPPRLYRGGDTFMFEVVAGAHNQRYRRLIASTIPRLAA